MRHDRRMGEGAWHGKGQGGKESSTVLPLTGSDLFMCCQLMRVRGDDSGALEPQRFGAEFR